MPAVERRPLRLGHAAVGFRRVLDVAGRLDAATAPELAAALEEALRGAERELWIDLTGLSAIDAAGVQVLLGLPRDVCRVALIVQPGPVRRSLERAGAADAFPVFPDRTTAHRHS